MKVTPITKIYLTNQCIDENPIKFLLFGCNSGQLGPVFGFNTGGQAHNTFFEIILRIGIVPSFLLGLFLIYKKPLLKNIFFNLLLVLIIFGNGGLLASPSMGLLLLISMNNNSIDDSKSKYIT